MELAHPVTLTSARSASEIGTKDGIRLHHRSLPRAFATIAFVVGICA